MGVARRPRARPSKRRARIESMSDPVLLAVLRQAHFLRDVSDEELESLAASLTRREFAEGDTVLRQGAAADALYFLGSGTVEVLRESPAKVASRPARLVAGDTLADYELLFRQPLQTSARAVTPAVVYRWDRNTLGAFLRTHPSALASLRFAAQSRRLAQRQRFRWLEPDEVVYALARRHPLLLAQGLLLPALLLAAAVALLVSDSAGLRWLGGGLGVVALALAAWQWIDWTNDYYMVTNRRAVWLEKVVGLYDSRQEAPLRMVLSVSVATEVVGRLIDYGDVTVRTYTGKIVFRSVSNPEAMAAVIEEHWRRMQSQDQQADRQAIEQVLQERLETPAETAPPARLPSAALPAPTRSTGLDRWTFQVRFEDKGVITYRKHWAVLLRATFAPAVLILAVAGFLGARLSGLVLGIPSAATLAGGVLVLVPLCLWWLYQYVDWVNDVYQLTADQILDIYKKPLAREERKVAPLENVLGTEVERKGLSGLLLNYGNVIASVGTTEFVFEGVFDPSGVQQDIVRYQEALFERKKTGDRQRRQEEMVEWLSAYHREVGQREAGRRSDRTGRE